MAGHCYNVPVILPDLRREESYRQIVDALEYLDAVSNDIFNRVSYRISENVDQLTSINNRIFTAQAKIDKLRSTNTKATLVFSSPKYPAPDRISDYHSIYQEVDPALNKVRKIRNPIESRLIEVDMDVIKAKKSPIHLNLKRTNKIDRAVHDAPERREGLGSLPKNLPSISSLLLFNTTENPYKKYVLRDPLEGAKTKTRDNFIEEENQLFEAPTTILRGDELDRRQKDSLAYVPVMLELPELDVPDMLPSLLYVASDLFYEGGVGASIAPSAANVIPDLPNLADPTAPAAQDAINLPVVNDAFGNEAPPPPPPPPTLAAPPLPSITEDGDSSGDEGGTNDGGGEGERSTLMDAIRKAGGASKAGLKISKNRKMERKAKKEEISNSGGGGDLLGDLSAALGRRRKAMSGKEREHKEKSTAKEDHNLGGGSMMDNISRMIPTLPDKPLVSKDSDNEGGW